MAGIIQPIKLKAVPLPPWVSVSLTPPLVTGPPVSQTTTWKVTNMSPPLSTSDPDTRLLETVIVGGPTVGWGAGMVVDTDSKRAPPQLLVL